MLKFFAISVSVSFAAQLSKLEAKKVSVADLSLLFNLASLSATESEIIMTDKYNFCLDKRGNKNDYYLLALSRPELEVLLSFWGRCWGWGLRFRAPPEL